MDVESVKLHRCQDRTRGDADLITLADDSVTIKGTIDTTGYIKVARLSSLWMPRATPCRWHLTVMGAAGMNGHPECHAGRDLALIDMIMAVINSGVDTLLTSHWADDQERSPMWTWTVNGNMDETPWASRLTRTADGSPTRPLQWPTVTVSDDTVETV